MSCVDTPFYGQDVISQVGLLRAASVTALGPTAFAATQEAIGALAFMPKMAELKPVNALGDPAGCLTGTFTKATLKALYLRHMR